MLQTCLIRPDHITQDFDCEDPDLNCFIRSRALEAGEVGVCRTYVLALKSGQVIAYYSLSAWLIGLRDATPGIMDGVVEKFSIPAVLLGKLAVDKPSKGLALSKHLIRDAVEKAFEASLKIGVRGMALHAKTDRLVQTYAKYGFSSADPKKGRYLMASLKQLREALQNQKPAS
jgi:predicted GNAT family N-acyltransferase